MMTHHVVHESFKNNISNNTHNIAQGAILFSGGQIPPLAPLNAILIYNVYTVNGERFMINFCIFCSFQEYRESFSVKIYLYYTSFIV